MDKKESYGDVTSEIYGSAKLKSELETYKRLLEYEIDCSGSLKPGAKERILAAAEEYAWARTRERYAFIKEGDKLWDDLINKLRGLD